MNKSVLVIGGTRYFGKVLVARLVEQGDAVTILTRGKTPDSFGKSVQRIHVDRSNSRALAHALEPHRFDLVYDQMCYNPSDARAICQILEGRPLRYVMASTIEVYDRLSGMVSGGYREEDLDLSRIEVDFDNSEPSYSNGKRQAEAVIASMAKFDWATVRIGHVLSGPDDFTGRLAEYVERARNNGILFHSRRPGKSSFIDRDSIADFLIWVGGQQECGPFNAASDDALTAPEIQRLTCAALGKEFRSAFAASNAPLTPFDYPTDHTMSNERARGIGYRFASIRDRLPSLVREHAGAAAA